MSVSDIHQFFVLMAFVLNAPAWIWGILRKNKILFYFGDFFVPFLGPLFGFYLVEKTGDKLTLFSKTIVSGFAEICLSFLICALYPWIKILLVSKLSRLTAVLFVFLPFLLILLFWIFMPPLFPRMKE